VDKYGEEHCSFIIETGFNLYFLYNIFLEAKETVGGKEGILYLSHFNPVRSGR